MAKAPRCSARLRVLRVLSRRGGLPLVANRGMVRHATALAAAGLVEDLGDRPVGYAGGRIVFRRRYRITPAGLAALIEAGLA